MERALPHSPLLITVALIATWSSGWAEPAPRVKRPRPGDETGLDQTPLVAPGADGVDWEPALTSWEVIAAERIIARLPLSRFERDGLIKLATERFEDRDEVLDFLALRPGQDVLDLGCGIGWFTIPIASEVTPRGMVFATEVRQPPLLVLGERLEEQSHALSSRVRALETSTTDPELPTHRVDVVFMAHLGFLLRDPPDAATELLLSNVRRVLRPTGRVVAIQWMGGPEGQDPLSLVLNLEDAGFELVEAEYDELNDTWLMEFLPR